MNSTTFSASHSIVSDVLSTFQNYSIQKKEKNDNKVPLCGSPCTNCRYYEGDCIRPAGHRQQNSRDPVERLIKPYTNKSTSLEQSQQCSCELSGLRPCPLCETKSELDPVTSSEEFPIAVGISSSAWAAPATNFDFFGLSQDLEDVVSVWSSGLKTFLKALKTNCTRYIRCESDCWTNRMALSPPPAKVADKPLQTSNLINLKVQLSYPTSSASSVNRPRTTYTAVALPLRRVIRRLIIRFEVSFSYPRRRHTESIGYGEGRLTFDT
ncbi:hypothetical protein V496_07057 [Pseudogymnoascus sp. VKM F-4515 (FW-2607)]|nr:hypothetical protein V496_07057 [Pseudogymnoascus sp. VKM F-4515 (FW-2607)]